MTAATTRKTRMTPRAVVAATSGNVLEWYDFTVYGFLAPILGKIFFPSEDPVASLLAAFAVLAVGYLARPIGSVIYGHDPAGCDQSGPGDLRGWRIHLVGYLGGGRGREKVARFRGQLDCLRHDAGVCAGFRRSGRS